MLRNTKELENFAIGATDGNIGHVKDFYFDDEAWVIRYLVVDTGTWLSSRKVLISPVALGHPNWTENILPVAITREQVKHSPDIDTEKPVSRQHEKQLLGYYGYPDYWGGPGLWEGGIYPNMTLPGYAGFISTPGAVQSEAESVPPQTEAARPEHDDPHLRSCKVVMGYHIQATDGEIGHVHSLLVDEATWAIRYIIVDTSDWWLGHKVLIAPQWIQTVSWSDSTVAVNLTRQAVKDAPPYDAEATLDRTREMGIYKHYGRPGYWADEMDHEAAKSRK